MNPPSISQKILSGHQLLVIKFKNLQKTFCQSTSQQLKAVKNSTKDESKKRKHKKQQ